jgi:hypothetical protein
MSNRKHLCLIELQGELLGEHNVARPKVALGIKAQPGNGVSSCVEFVNVHRGTPANTVRRSRLPADNVKMLVLRELLALRRRQIGQEQASTPRLGINAASLAHEIHERREKTHQLPGLNRPAVVE